MTVNLSVIEAESAPARAPIDFDEKLLAHRIELRLAHVHDARLDWRHRWDCWGRS
jgi:hypothetical protein